VGRRALIAALALGLSVFAHGLSAAQSDPFVAMNALRVEPPAAMPAVAFQTLEGQPATLAAFRGRPVLLTFFTTW
jgi:cytochrome oxidase Cu insertion factor (SCO1/SenC/PrrC family)